MTETQFPQTELLDVSGLDPGEQHNLLKTMVLIREFEEALEPLALAGKIPGGAHLSAGQEAIAVGASRALGDGDIVTAGHRSHHHALARGLAPSAVMAELFGKATGTCGGRGGSMHLADMGHGFFPGNAIVGANIGIAMGAALAAHLRGVEQVACAFFGDGAANSGRTWESLNMAAIWELPLIAVCENNLYAVETLSKTVTGGDSVAGRARSVGMAAVEVDGQDVCAVLHAVRIARERALAGEGPTFVEAMTYRWHGHSTGEDPAYRPEGELEQWQSEKDPIARLRRTMEQEALIDEGAVAEIIAGASETVRQAIEYAERSPFPDAASTTELVYSAGGQGGLR